MTRAEHLQWAKDRALKICDIGDTAGALTSMASDLQKHAETADHIGINLGMQMLVIGALGTQEQMRHFIEGFN